MILDSTPNPIPEQDSKSANWRDLDLTTRDGMNALQRVIAFRVGWRIVPHTPLYEEEDTRTNFRAAYDLLDPDGKIILYGYSDYGLRYWESLPQVPNWPKDANAALSLLSDTQHIYAKLDIAYVDVVKRVWKCEVNSFPYFRSATADTPALAVCLAWLTFMDAQARNPASRATLKAATDARQQARAQEGASDE